MPHFSEGCHIGQGIVLPGLNMVARAGIWGAKCDPVGGLLWGALRDLGGQVGPGGWVALS